MLTFFVALRQSGINIGLREHEIIIGCIFFHALNYSNGWFCILSLLINLAFLLRVFVCLFGWV